MILSLVMFFTVTPEGTYAYSKNYNNEKPKYIELTKDDLNNMHPDERAQIEKELKAGKKLISVTKNIVYFKRTKEADQKPLTEEQMLADKMANPNSAYDKLILNLYILDNTSEGSSYAVDYSFEGWFDWEPFPIADEGIVFYVNDFAGFAWGGNVPSYYRNQTAWAESGTQYTDSNDIGAQSSTVNAGYVARFKHNRRSTNDLLDHGWVFTDVHQTQKQGLLSNVVFEYFHTYSTISYSISISSSPEFSISPTSGQWNKLMTGEFYY